jgi:para-aminobenzoate synthetase/4-amino-4-deoxychorismate lyase
MTRTMSASGDVEFGSGWHGCGGRTFKSPGEVFVAREINDVRPTLARACAAAESGRHVAGFVSYEAAPAFDPAFKGKDSSTPLVWMAAFDAPQPYSELRPDPCPRASAARFAYDPVRYREVISELRGHIREGDVYQVNLTGPLDVTLGCEPYAAFRHLLQQQPVPFAAFFDTGDFQVLSCSPELFFERRGRRIVTRPMKGTVRRGRRSEEDDALERWLSQDEKSRAENLMIVDLLRNDLSRCCEPGSVRVPELFTTERYRTVIQMTSEVEGRLLAGHRTESAFAALFPCGSVTGAPKIRAMELIDRYEIEPRGVYCGAVGYMRGETAVFNVAIRTVTVRGAHARLGIGSGIVWDSDADAEFDECLLKARFLTDEPCGSLEENRAWPPSDMRPSRQRTTGDPPAASLLERAVRPVLIETMKGEGGAISLFERHADRLRGSAAALDYSFDEAVFRRRVVEATPGKGMHKIRATLSHEGRIEVETTTLGPCESTWSARLSDTRIDGSDPLRRHKSSHREAYDAAYRSARAQGYDEVIFLNRCGEVVEGSRSNVIAVFGERWITPLLRCGALPGVYRRYLIETHAHLVEDLLTVQDLMRADALFLCNAVCGLVPTRFHALRRPAHRSIAGTPTPKTESSL